MNALYKMAYLNSTATADGIVQVIMLYDKAIACLQQAKEAITAKNIETRFNKLERAYKIVSGLRDALDFSQGQEIAETLSEWYDGVALRIISINKSEDLSMCDLCIDNLKTMRDSWAETSDLAKDETPSHDSKPFIATSSGINNGSLSGLNLEI